jgi:osmotically-inducible protein OsmY
MDIIWGEAVASTDAWFGKLDGVLVGENTYLVTNLIIRSGFHVNKWYVLSKRLPISIKYINHWQQERLFLNISTSDFLKTSPIRNNETSMLVALGRDSVVLLTDGKRLRLRGLRLSNVGCRDTVTHLIVGTDMVHSSVLLPADAVTPFTSGEISASVGKAELDKLPAYRRDHFIESDLWESLYASDRVSDTDLKGVEAHVENSIVIVQGNGRTPSAIAEIVELARSVDGVTDVKSDLVSDWDVELAVAAYISKNARELAGSISAHSQLGLVTLTGHAPSEGSKASVAQGVACLGGVRGVIDRIEVQPEPSTHPDAEDGMPEEGVVSGEREAVEG